MIDKDNDGMIREDVLTDIEKKIFIVFLEHERARHYKDIAKINMDIHRLRK